MATQGIGEEICRRFSIALGLACISTTAAAQPPERVVSGDGTPLMIGPFAISELGVRTADFGNASAIREEGGDPDEVVVTGDRRRTRNRDRLAIGADQLRYFSSITFDKRARQVRLSCV